MSLLVADSVGKWFGGRQVLASASLRAVPGEVRALFGRNGAGKSTLLKIAAGWMQPDTGTVRFDGDTYLRASLPALAMRGLFYLPDRELLTPSTTVGRQLAWLRDVHGGGDVAESLARAGVPDVADVRPHALSGGERRRAELAAVLVRRPRCLLADEPLRGVAPADAEALLALLRELAAAGCAVVVTGHDAALLLDYADHVTWCTSGVTYELGAPAAARGHEAFAREYLGPGRAGVHT